MIDIRHTETTLGGIFEAWQEGVQVGEMTYRHPVPERMVIDHTQVFDGYEGKGIARQMVLAAVDSARAKGRKIVPLCSYARAVLTRTDEYTDIIG